MSILRIGLAPLILPNPQKKPSSPLNLLPPHPIQLPIQLHHIHPCLPKEPQLPWFGELCYEGLDFFSRQVSGAGHARGLIQGRGLLFGVKSLVLT